MKINQFAFRANIIPEILSQFYQTYPQNITQKSSKIVYSTIQNQAKIPGSAELCGSSGELFKSSSELNNIKKEREKERLGE